MAAFDEYLEGINPSIKTDSIAYEVGKREWEVTLTIN